jgi:hypothetical protein
LVVNLWHRTIPYASGRQKLLKWWYDFQLGKRYANLDWISLSTYGTGSAMIMGAFFHQAIEVGRAYGTRYAREGRGAKAKSTVRGGRSRQPARGTRASKALAACRRAYCTPTDGRDPKCRREDYSRAKSKARKMLRSSHTKAEEAVALSARGISASKAAHTVWQANILCSNW